MYLLVNYTEKESYLLRGFQKHSVEKRHERVRERERERFCQYYVIMKHA